MLRQRNIQAREFQKSAISQNKNLNKKKQASFYQCSHFENQDPIQKYFDEN